MLSVFFSNLFQATYLTKKGRLSLNSIFKYLISANSVQLLENLGLIFSIFLFVIKFCAFILSFFYLIFWKNFLFFRFCWCLWEESGTARCICYWLCCWKRWTNISWTFQTGMYHFTNARCLDAPLLIRVGFHLVLSRIVQDNE